MTPRHGYAIVPEESPEPVAVFFTLDDAVDWATSRIGHNQFQIRTVALRALPKAAVPTV
jgi:hypothetical protein